MSILGRVKENNAVTEAEIKDYTGGGFINESGVYNMKIEKAFARVSDGGAIGIVIQYGGDAMLENTMWITNKEGLTYFNKNGKDMPMPAYVDAKKLNYLLTGEMFKSITEIKTEQRVIKWYKYADDPSDESKKKKVDIELEAEVLVDWIGKEVKLLIQMVQKEGWDKDAKKPNGQGAVTKEGEPITEPTIIDMFGLDNRTATETFKDKVSEVYEKGLARIEKSPIRMFKAKKVTSTPKSSTTSSKQPVKPNVFG